MINYHFNLVPLVIWQGHETSFVIFLVRGWGLATNFKILVSSTLACHHTHISPPAPTILAVEATSSTSISVKWAAGANDGGISNTGYVVKYRPALDPASPFETHLLGEDVFSTVLDNLAPSTEYEVRVRVENGVGHSQPSVTMRAKTKVDGELNFQVVV